MSKGQLFPVVGGCEKFCDRPLISCVTDMRYRVGNQRSWLFERWRVNMTLAFLSFFKRKQLARVKSIHGKDAEWGNVAATHGENTISFNVLINGGNYPPAIVHEPFWKRCSTSNKLQRRKMTSKYLKLDSCFEASIWKIYQQTAIKRLGKWRPQRKRGWFRAALTSSCNNSLLFYKTGNESRLFSPCMQKYAEFTRDDTPSRG